MIGSVLTAAEREIGGVALLTLLAGLVLAATMAPGALDRQAALAGAEVPEHRVVEVDERADGRLLTAHVVVHGTPDGDGLVAVAAAVVEKLRTEQDYSGLRVQLYDGKASLQVGPTLGQAIDAPEGDWSKALRATRDWSAHRTVVEVLDKDWDARPKEEWLEIFGAWKEYQQQAPSSANEGARQAVPEGRPRGELVKQLGITEEQLDAAVKNVSAWSISGEPVEATLE